MHRTRMGLTREEVLKWAPEFGHLVPLRFVSLPATEVSVVGDFAATLAPWLPAAPSADRVVLPIHPGQWPHIRARVPSAQLLPDTRPALPQASVCIRRASIAGLERAARSTFVYTSAQHGAPCSSGRSRRWTCRTTSSWRWPSRPRRRCAPCRRTRSTTAGL